MPEGVDNIPKKAAAADRSGQLGLTGRHDVRLRTSHGIVPALDIESLQEMQRVVERTTQIDGVVAYKLGSLSTLRLGLASAVQALREVTDLPLLYDHQKAGPDVPSMAPKFTAACKEGGVDGLILFPLAGPKALDEFVSSALNHRLLPIVGGELPLPEYSVKGGGYVANDALRRILERSLGQHVDHFVIPATDTEKLGRLCEWLLSRLEKPYVFLPGIGALGGSISEAFAAASGCRAYAVVGRAVYAASDPAQAAHRLAQEALQFA